MSKEKKIIFDCPLRVVLTDDGINSLLASNRQPQKIKIADRSSVYGIRLTRFSFNSVKRMVEQNYTHRIEMPVCREDLDPHDVLDLTKLFMFNMFYRKFDYLLFSYLRDSLLINSWNSLKTGIVLEPDTVIKETAIRQIAEKRNIDLDKIKRDILAPVQEKIVQSSTYSVAEKNLYLLMSEKFVNSVRPVIWLCCGMEKNQELVETFISMTQELLESFLRKSKIPNMLGKLIESMLKERENKSMFYFARENHPTYTDQQILEDQVLRRNLFIENSSSKTKVSVCWEIDLIRNSLDQLVHRLNILIFSAVDDFAELSTALSEIQKLDTHCLSYDDYMIKYPLRNNNPYLMLPFLMQEAVGNEISFSVDLNKSTSKDISIINLKFQF